MASSSSVSETPIVEQVITEFFAKSLHIILESRSPFVSSRNYTSLSLSSPNSSPKSPSTGSSGPRDKWFNLALKDCPAALENFDMWRQSNLEPLIIDIVLVSRFPMQEKLLERWVIQYETRIPGTSTGTSSMYKKTYKGSIILLRSLYSLVRLLPAYNLFRDLNSSGIVRPISLSHKILPFANPLTRLEESEMGNFAINPIETPFGRLSVSVSYKQTLDIIGSEPATQLSTEFIPDYVGSPKTDPLRRFQTLPHFLFNPKPVIPIALNPKPVLLRCDSAPAGRGEGRVRNLTCEDKQLVRYGELRTGTSLPKEICDRYDESDLGYHFAQDKSGIIDAFNRIGVYEGEKSQAAVVGEFLRMLQKATKLQIGYENTDPKPLRDALYDLRGFMLIRNVILSQTGSHPRETDLEK